ncbi:TPA: hypothetical protein EYP27_02530, partial [Candidatus Bathyarchaeota archaeon]|nr:hypothetical protein [Candidatus Bathyarchaeota archaeon]
DAITREGHRLAVTFADEVTLPGSTFCLRKFPEEPLSMAHIIKYGTLTPLIAAYLWLIAEHKGYIIILGGMGTGKTTLLNCILTMLPPTVKIATIEDTPEIKIPHKNWQRFKSRQAIGGMEGARFEVTLFDLVKLALRYRPDYVSVGEARGEEITALNQAALLGHGSFTTFHAESPEAALQRMRNPPLNVPEGNLMHISCFIQLARIVTAEGKHIRRVTEVAEIVPGEREIRLNRLFTWTPRTDSFNPTDPAMVVERSVRLTTVMKLTGMGSEEIYRELRARAALLGKLVEEEKLSYRDFSEAVLKYHVERRGLIAQTP